MKKLSELARENDKYMGGERLNLIIDLKDLKDWVINKIKELKITKDKLFKSATRKYNHMPDIYKIEGKIDFLTREFEITEEMLK